MTTKKAHREDLLRDERGAIMVLGLGSALLLIGALWFLMGIADTLVWRESVQEAVDSAAFSAAAANAYGMNFIAAINLVILALVTIHLIIGLVANALSLVGAILLVPPATPAGADVLIAATKVRSAQTSYDAFMLPVSVVLGAGQAYAALQVPQLGTQNARVAGQTYRVEVLALGASNVPSPPMNFPVGKNANGKIEWKAGADDLFGLGGARLGLPVALEPMNAMCARPYFWVADWLSSAFQKLPGISTLLDSIGKIPIIGQDAQSRAKEILNETFRGFAVLVTDPLVALECNSGAELLTDPWVSSITAVPGVSLGGEINPLWGAPGGKKMWGVAKNDSQWMKVWAWTLNESKVDKDERKVAIARRKYGDVGDVKVEGLYIAQAEFYFDCTDTESEWDDVGCNGYSSESQLAIFNMRWRARLRRYQAPDFRALLFDQILAWLDGLDIIKEGIETVFGKFGVKTKIKEVTDLGEIIRKAIDAWVFDKFRDALLDPPKGSEIIH